MHEIELNIDVPSAHINEVWRTVHTHSAKDSVVFLKQTNPLRLALTHVNPDLIIFIIRAKNILMELFQMPRRPFSIGRTLVRPVLYVHRWNASHTCGLVLWTRAFFTDSYGCGYCTYGLIRSPIKKMWFKYHSVRSILIVWLQSHLSLHMTHEGIPYLWSKLWFKQHASQLFVCHNMLSEV